LTNGIFAITIIYRVNQMIAGTSDCSWGKSGLRRAGCWV